MKHLLRVAIVILVVLVVAAVAARWYLKSHHVARQVTARLEEMLGTRVRVAEVDIGVTGESALGGVELYEPGRDAPEHAWLTADRLQTDVSALDVVAGSATPTTLRLTGTTVTLRFNQQGRLLTRLPGHYAGSGSFNTAAIPELTVQGSRVLLLRDDGPGLDLQQVSAELSRKDGKLTITGHARDPRWGAWELAGTLDSQQAVVTLQSRGKVHVTQEMLDSLPFVTTQLWEEVRIPAGDTPGKIILRYDLSARVLHYRVEMTPEQTAVQLPGLDFRAKQAGGRVIMDDGLVELRSVAGQAYGGTLAVDADLDFRSDAPRLHFPAIRASGLQVDALPASWKLPRQIQGKLVGKAALDVTFRRAGQPARSAVVVALPAAGGPGPVTALAVQADPGPYQVRTRGSGKGQIREARVGGQPASEPITLELQAVPGGFRFRQPEAEQPAVEPPLPQARAARPDAPGPARFITPASLLQPNAGHTLYGMEELPGAAASGMSTLYRQVLSTGHSLAGLLPSDLGRPRAPAQKSARLAINLRMEKVDLARFVGGLGLKLPFPLAGQLSFRVRAGIPVDRPGDARAYQADGQATVADLTLGTLKLDRVEARVEYKDGILKLHSLQARLAAGVFRGTAQLPVVPLGTLSADGTLDDLPLGPVAPLAGLGSKLRGEVSGWLHAEAPGARLQEIGAWAAHGQLTLARAVVLGLAVQDGRTNLDLGKGRLVLTDARARLVGGPVNGSAELDLTAPYRYRVEARVQGADVAAWQGFTGPAGVPSLTGRLDTTFNLEGTLQPLSGQARGVASGGELAARGLHLAGLRFDWQSQDSQVVLKEVKGRLYDGTLTGSASLPLAPGAAGALALHVAGLDLGELGRALPDLPVPLQGQADADLNVKLPPARAEGVRALQVNLDVTAGRVRIGGAPVQELRATLDDKQGLLDYRLQGKAAGGAFELSGQWPRASPKQAEEARLRVRGVRLSRLVDAWTRMPGNSPVHGLLDLELHMQRKPGGPRTGGGKLMLSAVRWHRQGLGDLRSDLVIEGDTLRIRRLSGNLGTGVIEGRATFNLNEPRRSAFALDLEDVDAGDLVEPWLGPVSPVRGRVRGRIRGRLGQTWTGTADVTLDRGEVAGAEITDSRLPLSWEFAPGEGRARMTLDDGRLHLAHGQVTGRANLEWGPQLSLDANVRLQDVDLRALLRSYPGATQLGGGQVSGTFTVAGRSIHSTEDMTGLLQLSLRRTQALGLPVLNELGSFLGLGPSTTFTRGSLRARLARGLWRLERLALDGRRRLYADGTVTMEGGLNLHVAATPGQGALGPFAAVLALRIPVAGPIPLLVLAEANNYLSSRLIHLRVTGTLRNPAVRVLPLATLTQEGVRFFVSGSGAE